MVKRYHWRLQRHVKVTLVIIETSQPSEIGLDIYCTPDSGGQTSAWCCCNSMIHLHPIQRKRLLPFVAIVKLVVLKVLSLQPERRSSILHQVSFGLLVEEDVILPLVNVADMP